MDSILNHKVMKYLENNSLLNDRLYGFRKNRSAGDLMALLTETWNRSVHLFGKSKIVALDISRAFDRVWHQGLISKVKSYAFIRWLSDFLCNRSIRVVIDGINSNVYPVNSGVPQGSVTSPTLFLLFLNNLLYLTTL